MWPVGAKWRPGLRKRWKHIRSRIFIAAVLLASLAQAKEPKHYRIGTLLQMDSAEWGVDENRRKSVVGELVGTDSDHKKTHALLRQNTSCRAIA